MTLNVSPVPNDQVLDGPFGLATRGDHETRTHPPGRHTGVLLDLDLAAEAHRLRNRRRCAVNDRARRNPIITGPFTVWHFGHRCIVVLLVVVLAERCVLETSISASIRDHSSSSLVIEGDAHDPTPERLDEVRRRDERDRLLGRAHLGSEKLSPILRLHPEVRLPRHVDVFRVDGGLSETRRSIASAGASHPSATSSRSVSHRLIWRVRSASSALPETMPFGSFSGSSGT